MNDRFQPLDADFAYDLPDGDGSQITEEMRGYLRETARWSMVFAVLAYICVAILGVAYIITLTRQRGMMGEGENSAYQTGEMIGMILVFALVIGIGYRFAMSLHHFSRNFKKADRTSNQAALESAFSNLARFYRIAGLFFAAFFLIRMINFVDSNFSF